MNMGSIATAVYESQSTVYGFQVNQLEDMIRLGTGFARAVKKSENFKQRRAAVIGIIGAVGSGKTTLSDAFKTECPALKGRTPKEDSKGQFTYRSTEGLTINRYDQNTGANIAFLVNNGIYIVEHARRDGRILYDFICSIYGVENGRPVLNPANSRNILFPSSAQRYIEVEPQNGQESDQAFQTFLTEVSNLRVLSA